jgi:hypothetical protein
MSKKRLVLIILVAFVLAAVGNLLWGRQAWSGYSVDYNKRFAGAKVYIDSIDSTTKLDNIVQIQAKLTEELELSCDVNPLFGWQGFISQYSDEIKDCQRQKDNLSKLSVSLGETVGYLQSEQELAAIISIASNKTIQNNQADKWHEIESFWRQAIIDTNKLKDTNQFKMVKSPIIIELTNIADAWQRLSSANDAKNRQQFEEAQFQIGQVYTSLTEVSSGSKVTFDKLIGDLKRDYEKIDR